MTHAADTRSLVLRLFLGAAIMLGYLVNPDARIVPTLCGLAAVMYAVAIMDAALTYRSAGTEDDREACFNLAVVYAILLLLCVAGRALTIGGGL